MANIIKTIEEAKKRGASDSLILDQIIKDNPKKADQFKKERNKKDDSELLQEIIKSSKKKNKKEKKSKSKEAKKKSKKDTKNKAKKKKKKKEEKTKRRGNLFNKLLSSEKIKSFFASLSFTKNLLVGIDISDHSIEVLLLNKEGQITSYGRSILEEGLVKNGEIINQKELSETLKKTLRETKPEPLNVPEHTRKKKLIKLKKKEHKAIVSLPDSKTYIQLFEFENKKNLYKKIEEQVRSTIPFDFDELYWDFIEVSGSKKVNILCVATPRDIVDMYIYFFKSTNIEPVAFEIEGASIGRALLPLKTIREGKKKNKKRKIMADGKERMILDMGAKTSVLSIFNRDADLAVSVSLPYAGYYFTKKIAEEFDISIEKAEEKKQKEGFTKGKKSREVLEEQAEKIIGEIKEASKYYQRNFNGEIKELILSGGTALLPEINQYLVDNLEMEVSLGNPLKKIKNEGLLKKKEPILYSNVIGLGLRSLLDKPIETGINLLPEEVKSQAKEKQNEKNYNLFIAIGVFLLAMSVLGYVMYHYLYLPYANSNQGEQGEIVNVNQEEEKSFVIINRQLEERVNVYQSSNLESEVITTLNQGTKREALEEIDNWVKIKTKDSEGWVQKEFLEQININNSAVEEDQNSNEEENNNTQQADRNQDFETVKLVEIIEGESQEIFNLRIEPNPDAEIVSTVKAGQIYEYSGSKSDWIEISVEDERLWISENYAIIFEKNLKEDQTVEDLIENFRE